MTPLAVGALVSACTFAGALFGLNVTRVLPEAHLTKETQEVVRLGTGMVSVLASLVLGLLIATAKTGSDATDHALRSYATDLIVLKGTLRAYGQESKQAQDLLKRSAQRVLQDISPRANAAPDAVLEDVSARRLLEQAQSAIVGLSPAEAQQRWLQDQAKQTIASLIRQRWLLVEQAGPTVSPILVTVLVSWLVSIFASFGLNAPRNATVVAAFLLCALAIGGAVFLVLEMDSPFAGLLRIPDQPMRRALALMDE